MKKIIIVLISIIILTGCNVKEEIEFKYPELYSNGNAFEAGSYVDEKDDSMYMILGYNERVYMPYGTLKGTLKEEDLVKCIGFVKSNYSENDTSNRVFTLTGDDELNYLMLQDVSNSIMDSPMFFRAIDTKDLEIDTPNFIDSLDYNYWK